MIAKARAISHGDKAIEYAMRESKGAELLKTNLIQNLTPGEIYQEFIDVSKYSELCTNKFIRIEIGIAPNDEVKLTKEQLGEICNEFSKRFGFENHQWIACSHGDTDNLHMHMIVNRIGLDQKVFDTSFISMKAGLIAEKISRDMGLTIANEIQAKRKMRTHVVNFQRMMVRTKIEKLAHAVLSEKPTTLKQFNDSMNDKGITITEMKNKKGNTYGLRFTGYDETFKGSTIGKEFGYNTLLGAINSNLREEINQSREMSDTLNNNYSEVSQSSNILSTIGSIVGGLQTGGDYMNDEDEDENKKQSKRRRNVKIK